MSFINAEALKASVADGDPCGPDLELEADHEYLSFFNDASFALPGSFFGPDGPFNPADPDFQERVELLPKRLEALLKRTRDVRLLVFWSKLAILKRDVGEFASTLETTFTLLEQRWDEVHPRADEESSFAARMRVMEELKQPIVTFSVQFLPLCRDKRRGDISLRSKLAAVTEGEPPLTEAQIVQAFQSAGADAIGAKRAEIERVTATLSQIRATFIEKTQARDVPDFGKLLEHFKEILRLFDIAFPRETGEAQGDGNGISGPAPAGQIRNAADVRRALDCAIDYFVRKEPSNPAVPLLGQARELHGKSFIDILDVLLPREASDATFPIGEHEYFSLNIKELARLTPQCDAYGQDDEPETPYEEFEQLAAPNPEPAEAAQESLTIAVGEDADSAPSVTDGPDFTRIFANAENEPRSEETASEVSDAPLPAVCAEPSAEIEPVAPLRPNGELRRPARPNYSAESRAQAMALLGDIATYLRGAEPANPIPWLIDRARALAEKDFLSVLNSVLPRNSLRRRED